MAKVERAARVEWAVRVACLATLAVVLRTNHGERASLRGAAPPDLDAVRRLVPGAESLDGPHHSPSLGASWRTNDDDAPILVSTSPDGDDERGYSGATSLVLAFDDERCRGAAIQWSDDTDEHVARIEQSGALGGLRGSTAQDLVSATLDAATGATLTARAIERALAARFGGEPRSIFGPDARSEWSDRLAGAKGRTILTSPAADDVVGYGGPSAAAIVLDEGGTVERITLLDSFDNEPYVGYVTDDPTFGKRWRGATLEELAAGVTADGRELSAGLDGVSGATMTSMAVLRGAGLAAKVALTPPPGPPRSSTTWRDRASFASLSLAGLLLVLARKKPAARKWARRAALALVVVGVGAIGGHLVSLAQWIGLAERGSIGSAMLGLLALVAAIGPLVFERNVYCHDLCPHGAVQQALRPRSAIGWKVSSRGEVVPHALLLGAILWLVVAGNLDAAKLEPFDAWSLALYAPASATIAVLGLAFATRVSMGYCRFACPTGALLGALQRSIPRLSRTERRLVTGGYVLVTALALVS